MMRIITIAIITCNIRYSFTSSIYHGSKDIIESQTQCSKYDFEEKVLEKLVRMEHKIDIYEQKIKNFEESVMFKLNEFNESVNQRNKDTQSMIRDTFKEERSALNSSVQSLILDTFQKEKSSLNSSLLSLILNKFETEKNLLNSSVQTLILDTFKEEKNVFNSSLENVIEDVMVKSDNMANRLTAQLKQIRKDHSSTVLFKAVHLKEDTNLQGKILVFNTVITNIGHGYDKSTGIFTAPVSGVYLFAVQLCPDKGDHVKVFIIANEKQIGRLTFKNSSDNDDVCVFSYGLQNVLKGQKVWILCSYANHKGDVIYNTSVPENGNSFSGILLNPN